MTDDQKFAIYDSATQLLHEATSEYQTTMNQLVGEI
jgi:hypothetical protein